MKGKLFIALSFLLLFEFCFSQTIFQRTYGAAGSTEISKKVLVLSNGYIMAGYAHNTTSKKDIFVVKTDASGNISWSKTYGGNNDDEAFDIVLTSDGGFAITGLTKSFAAAGTDSSNAFIMKLNNSGNIVWSSAFGGNNIDAGNALVESSDSGFVVTGYTSSFGAGNKDVLISRFDKNGNNIWMKAIGGTAAEIGNAICKTTSNNYMIVGTTGITGNQNIIFSTLITLTGNLKWQKTYNFSVSVSNTQRIGLGVLENTAKQFIITGKTGQGIINDAQPFLFNMDSTGNNVNWAYAYILNSGNCSAQSVQQLPDGGYILAASMGNYYPALIRLNSSGIRQWSRFYGSLNSPVLNGFGYSAAYTGDKGFALTGYYAPSSASDTTALLIKTDSLGNSSCNFGNDFGSSGSNSFSVIISQITATLSSGGTSFGISPAETTVTTPLNTYCIIVGNNDLQDLKILSGAAPNPFSTQTKLLFNTHLVNAEINVYDVLGKKIKTISNVSGEEFELLRDNLESGIYLIVLKHKETISPPMKLIVTD